MPHECVECGDVFDDGSDEVFEGCPSCGATKFFYVKEVSDSPSEEQEQTPETPQEATASQSSPSTPETTEGSIPETQTGGGDDDILEADSEYETSFGGRLGDDESDDANDEITEVGSEDERTLRRARADEARRQLMDQFETIRIVEPGSYELNLMNLYEEDEKIIALQEDGRYQVSLPSTFED